MRTSTSLLLIIFPDSISFSRKETKTTLFPFLSVSLKIEYQELPFTIYFKYYMWIFMTTFTKCDLSTALTQFLMIISFIIFIIYLTCLSSKILLLSQFKSYVFKQGNFISVNIFLSSPCEIYFLSLRALFQSVQFLLCEDLKSPP